MSDTFLPAQKEFQFACTQCAECCTGDQSVVLNLFDLYKLSRFLRFANTIELFEQNLLLLKKDEQNNVYRPYIRFKKRPFKFCPFLTNELQADGQLKGWCQLHPHHKPLVCALSPIGISYDVQNHQLEFLFVPPTNACPGLNQPSLQNLEAYLAPYQTEIEFQITFFKILEVVKNFNWQMNDFKTELYSFPVQTPFESILQDFKKRFFATIHF